MDFRVTLIETEEGVAVSCPSLRGCHSQGETREDAVANIRIAIQEWLEAEQLEKAEFKISEEIVDAAAEVHHSSGIYPPIQQRHPDSSIQSGQGTSGTSVMPKILPSSF